ncbi:protein rcsF [Escherichia coli BIDMC 74]|nr:protein rcsF [Escherichia coli BIDMC 74]
MRALPICLVALMLSGCSMLSRSPVEPVQSTAPQPKAEPAKPKAPRATPVRIYPRFYVSTSKSIIKALINMHSFEIQLSPIG